MSDERGMMSREAAARGRAGLGSPFALGALLDSAASGERFSAAGLSAPAALEKAALLAQAARALLDGGLEPSALARVFFVPGRIEVLGKHTDYGGGRSMVAVPERGFVLAACARRDAAVRILAAGAGEEARFEMHPGLAPPVGRWANYPMTVGRRLARNFAGPLRGADIAFVSDLPPAAGMSSSSALMVAVFLALSKINDLESRKEYRADIEGLESLGGYLATIENGQSFGSLAGDKGVGTFGGSEDHTAILCCRPNTLSQYLYCPVRFERTVPVPGDCVFAIGASGVVAEKTGEAMEKFNRASRLVASIGEIWRRETGRRETSLGDILAASPSAAAQLRELLRKRGAAPFSPRELADRFEHFVAENEEIVPAAGDALARGGLEEFGRLVDRSQAGAERLLGNQVPETVFLARCARELGAGAASAFGAGFGGSVWALAREQAAERFIAQWARRYREAFPQAAARASFFLTRAGPAAFELGRSGA